MKKNWNKGNICMEFFSKVWKERNKKNTKMFNWLSGNLEELESQGTCTRVDLVAETYITLISDQVSASYCVLSAFSVTATFCFYEASMIFSFIPGVIVWICSNLKTTSICAWKIKIVEMNEQMSEWMNEWQALHFSHCLCLIFWLLW